MAITQSQLQTKAASIAKTRISAKTLKKKLSEKYAGVEKINTVAVIGNGLVSNSGTYSAATFTAEIGSAVDVVNVGRLASAVYAPASSQTGVGSARTSGTSNGTTAPVVSDVYLRADGTRQLEGNLAVVNGVTIDGVDISVHAANPDAHHTKLHSIVDPLHHNVTGAQLSVVGLYAIDTLGILPTTSRGDQNANTILRTGASKDLYVSILDTPKITTQSGNDLIVQPATKKSITYGAIISIDSVVVGSTGGAILQGIVDFDNSYSRAFVGHNARWDSTTNLWNIDLIGANDASGFLLRNSAAAIDVIFHATTGNVARTMTHAEFIAGAKITLTNSGRIGANTTSPSYEFDTPGMLRAQTSIITPLLTTTSGDLTIDPAGVVLFPQSQTIKTSNFNSAFPIAGFQINEKQVANVGIGVSVLTIGEIQADSLAVKVFVADETRVDRGNQLWAKSFGILAADFTIPSAINGTVTVTFEDSPALPGAIFSNGDWIMFQQIDRGTGLVIAYFWGTVSGYNPSSTVDEQSWTYTHKVGSVSTVGSPIVLKKGRIAIDWGQSGQAVIALSTVDESGSPYIKLMRWSGITGPYDTNTRKTLVAIGDLGSGVGNPYYSPTGDGIWIQPGLSQTRFLVADDNNFRIQGVDLRMFNASSNQTVDLSSTDGSLKLGTNIASGATTGFTFDGTTGNLTIGSASYASSVTVYGTINITGGNAAKNDFSNLTTAATIDQVNDGSAYKRTNANEKTGAGRAYNALSTTNNLVTSVIPATAVGNPGSPGLFLGSDYMGYHNGSGTAAGWKTYLDSSGNFRFQGSATNNYLQWAAASNKLQGVGGGIEQWYASAVDGKLYAAGGSIGMDSTGLWLLMNSSTGWATANAITFRSSSNWSTVDAALLSRTVTSSRYVSLLIDPNTTPVGLEIIASTTAQRVNITHDLTVQGSIDAISGITVNGVNVSLSTHNHNSQYLALSGGTLTGTLTARDIVFAADNTYDIGTSTNRVQDLYVVNLHVDTLVGTPEYSHSHTASDIISGVFSLARIPTTWSTALTLDADSGGTSNYLRWLTQTATGKAWDLIGRAHDYATTNQQNDLLLTFYDGTTTHIAFQADSGTRVIDFGQTPTVGGTAVSLSNHNHDASYVPLARTITTGAGLTGGGALSANITISHADTSSVADVANTNGNVLRSITFDTYGHVQTVASYDLDGRYYTETESDARFINVDGDTLTGNLIVSSGITIDGIDISAHAADINAHHAKSHSITSSSDHTVTGSQWQLIGLTGTNTLGIIDSSTNPGSTEKILRSTSTGGLTLVSLSVPLITTTSADLTFQPSTKKSVTYGAIISMDSAVVGSTGGAIIQGVVDSDNSFSRAFIGHNARWDSTTNLWNIDPIGANDASGFLLRNSAAAIDVIFHATTGNVARTMTHAEFIAGTKITLTSTGRIGVNTTSPSYEFDTPGTLRTQTSVITPLITTTSGDLTIDPIGVVLFPQSQTIKSVNFNSTFPISGFQINEKASTGISVLTIGEIQADSLAVKVFVADETRVDRGNQLWAKSFGIVAADFTIPSTINGTVTVTFEDSPAITGALFSNTDWLMFQQIDRTSGLTIGYSWGTVSGYTSNPTNKEQSWTFTLKSGATSVAIKKGRIAIDWGQTGQGIISLSTVDSSGSPYIKLMRWDGATGPYDTNTRKTIVAIGDLGSGVGNSYYSPAGDGIWIQPGLSASRFLVADDNNFRIQGIDLRMYNSSNQTVDLSAANGSLKLGTNIASSTTTGFTFDGATGNVTIGNASYASTVTLYGQIAVKAGSSGYSNLTDKPTTLGDINSGESTKLSGIQANATVGATWGTNLNSIPTRFGEAPSSAGLYLTPTNLGYYDGSAWKAWIASTGQFYFGGSSGAHLEWNGSKLRGLGTDGVTEQWYAQSTDGKFYAGAGAVKLDSNGITLTAGTGEANKITWYNGATRYFEMYGYNTGTSYRTVLSARAPNFSTPSELYLYSVLTDTNENTLLKLTPGLIAIEEAGFSVSHNGYSFSFINGEMYMDGEMSSFLDMGGNDILNAGTIAATTGITVNGVLVSLSTHHHNSAYVPLTRTITAGAGMTGGGALSADITISHLDTSNQASVSNTGLNFIQSITLDTYGHVTAIGSAAISGFLPSSGGTLTGTLTARDILFPADNTYDIGSSGSRVQDLYVNNLHVNTVVGTPAYTHSHAANDIISGILDFARIPTTWTGSLTLDADSAGTSNYVRWLTQTTTGKAWDLIGRAYDYATTSQQNDMLLTFYDGTTTYVVFQADSGTRVVDFGQTPTVGGTAVSLSNHNHDSVYVPLTRTITAGGGIIGGGALSANITISHADTSSVADVTNANGNVLRSITFDTYGHVQTVSSYDLDARYYTETEITSILTGYVPSSRVVNAGGGMTGGGALSADITISHLDTSSQASVSNTGLNFIQSVTLDTYGHITALTSGDIGSALDARYVNVTGDTMTGTLIVSGAPLISVLTGTVGGAIIQGIIDADNSFSRVWMGHNAEWDSVANLWTTDAIGANDAAGFLIPNNSASIALIFHASSGNTQRTMDHATFVAGEKFRFTNTGRLGVLNASPSYEIDVTGSIRATTSLLTPSISTTSGILTITSAAAVINITGAIIGSSSASFVGAVTAAADIDSNHTLGKGVVGYALATDTASFSHYDQNTSTNYGFAQSALGRSVVNAATGQTVDLSIANTPQWTVNVSAILPRGSAQVDIGDYNRLVRKLNAAELSVQTLVAKNVISTIGGDILVTPTTKLLADISSSSGGVGQSNLYANVAAFWRLEESSGTRFDAKGGSNLSDTGTVASIAGKIGTAANFSGINYLSANDSTTLSVSDIDFYLSCWIYIGNDTGANRYILFKGASTSGSRSWALYLNGAIGAQRARFQVWNTGMGSNQTVTASGFGNLAINTWYFVEAWHNASSNLIGVAVNRTETTAAWSSGVNDDTGPFSIGATGGTSNFTGYIDEVGFWKNYIPNTTERNTLYNSGTGVTWSDIYRYGATDINLDVENNSLRVGEYVIMKTAPGGVAQQEKMKITGGPSAISGGFRYTASRDLDVTSPNNWYAGDAVASQQKNVGEGYLWLTSTSTVYGHTGPSLLGYVRTGTNVDDVKPVFVKGNLRSLVDYVTDEYGDAAGNDLTLSPTNGFKGYTIDRTNGLRLFNTEIKLYDSGVESVRVNSTVGIRLTTGAASVNRLSWYNAINGYDQGYIQNTLSSGTSALLIRAQAKDISTGAFSGNADITISNSVTSSSIRFLANDGSVNGPNYHLTVANTGVAISSLGLSISPLAGISGLTLNTPAGQGSAMLYLTPVDNGTSYGPHINIGRNSNGSTPAAGFLYLTTRSNTGVAVWVDNTGTMRLNTGALPTNPNDVSGIVVGSQSSYIGLKTDIVEWNDTSQALNDVLGCKLYDYRFKNDESLRRYKGIVINELDRGAWFSENDAANQTPALNERNLFGYLIAATKELNKKIEEQKSEIESLNATIVSLQSQL